MNRVEAECFTTLWIYTILKHRQVCFQHSRGFTTLWIYTILKPKPDVDPIAVRFTTLWIYTILKRGIVNCRMYTVLLPYGFTLFSNLK